MPPAAPVLVVDDEEQIRAVVGEILRDEGFTVIEASNGQEALARVRDQSPVLILLDMRMPVMNGWEFAAAYRALPGPHAPIVVMTAAQHAGAWCAEIKGEGCVAKPFELDELLSEVARLAA
jgi:CheY-like chemotaxis protein